MYLNLSYQLHFRRFFSYQLKFQPIFFRYQYFLTDLSYKLNNVQVRGADKYPCYFSESDNVQVKGADKYSCYF